MIDYDFSKKGIKKFYINFNKKIQKINTQKEFESIQKEKRDFEEKRTGYFNSLEKISILDILIHQIENRQKYFKSKINEKEKIFYEKERAEKELLLRKLSKTYDKDLEEITITVKEKILDTQLLKRQYF